MSSLISASSVIDDMAVIDDREPGDRSRSLVRAANHLLDQSGLEGLTIRAVLMHAGLARRAFYEQFQGKDDLILAVFEETLKEAATRFGAAARLEDNPVDALRTIVMGLVIGQIGAEEGVSSRRSAALSREHLRLAEARPQDLQSALSPLLALMSEQIEKGVAAGLIRPCDARLHAGLVYNFIAATLHVELLAEEGETPDRDRRRRLADTIWEFCSRALVA